MPTSRASPPMVLRERKLCTGYTAHARRSRFFGCTPARKSPPSPHYVRLSTTGGGRTFGGSSPTSAGRNPPPDPARHAAPRSGSEFPKGFFLTRCAPPLTPPRPRPWSAHSSPKTQSAVGGAARVGAPVVALWASFECRLQLRVWALSRTLAPDQRLSPRIRPVF